MLGWGAYAALNASFMVGSGVPATAAWAGPILLSVGGVTLSHLLRRVIRERNWQERPPLQLALRAIAAAALLGVLLNGAYTGLVFGALRWVPVSAFSLRAFLIYALNLAGVFLLWQLIYFAVHLVNRSRRAELEALRSAAAAKEAELKTLRAQLNPHFLFNSLNTLRGLILESPPKAQEVVTRLANILRYSLVPEENALVPLARELEIVSDYLALEAVRMEHRLRTDIHVTEDCLQVPVPMMLVQTLVENGIKHGISRLEGGGCLSLSAVVVKGTLELDVTNPRADTEDGALAHGTKTGLTNARNRLRHLFGDRASLQLETLQGHVTARVRLPVSR